MKQLRTVGLVLLLPAAGFQSLRQRPKAALAVILLICACIGAHLAVHSRIDVDAQKRLTAADLTAEQPGQEVSDEDVEKKSSQVLNMKRIGGYVLYVLGIPLGLLILSLVFWVLLAAWGPGRGLAISYRLMAHAWLPLGLRQLVALPVILSHPSIDPEATAGLFRSSVGAIMGPTAFPGAFLLDPFAVWVGALIYLCGRNLGRGRIWSGVAGLVFWVIGALAMGSL